MPARLSHPALSAMTLVLYLLTGCEPPEEDDLEEDAFASDSIDEAEDSSSTTLFTDAPEEAALTIHDASEDAAGHAAPDDDTEAAVWSDRTAVPGDDGAGEGRPRPCRPSDIIKKLIADGGDGPGTPPPNCNGGG